MKDTDKKRGDEEETLEELKTRLRKKLVNLIQHPAAPEEFKSKLVSTVNKLIK